MDYRGHPYNALFVPNERDALLESLMFEPGVRDLGSAVLTGRRGLLRRPQEFAGKIFELPSSELPSSELPSNGSIDTANWRGVGIIAKGELVRVIW